MVPIKYIFACFAQFKHFNEIDGRENKTNQYPKNNKNIC